MGIRDCINDDGIVYSPSNMSKDRVVKIDMNVSDPEPFVKAQEELMGKGQVAPMIAYGTQKPKSAFRMYARAKGLPMDIQSVISKQIEAYERALQNADDEDEKEAIFIEDYVDAEYMEHVEASTPYQGIVVSKSQAPCGYLLYDGDIESDIGIIRVNGKGGKKVSYCTVVDGATADAFGFVKNDVLTVQVVAINAAASAKAGLPYLSAEELIERTKNDPATWNVFAHGYTLGVNQCQGAKTIEKLVRYKPRSLQDMSAFVAAIRPGFKSMVQKFLGREKFSYGVPAFDEQLHNDSSGSSWLLYQEDVMKVLSLAGFPLEETYPIIKAISKKKVKVIEKAHERFIEGFIAYQKEQGEKSDDKARENSEMVWQILYNSSSYSFNACLSGDTVIKRVNDPDMTVKDMFLNWHTNDRKYDLEISMTEDGTFCANWIVDIRPVCAPRITYTVHLDNEAEITCTPNHKFPTPDGEKMMRQLNVGDWLYVREDGCKIASMCRIAAIEYAGVQDVYDVQMGGPWHNLVVNDGIVTSNSHSVAVALDAIYGAYLKAHYTHEYYATLLEVYTAKGDKNKVAEIKAEMLKAFDIHVVPARFRQDNRTFSYDKKANTITDALPSIRNLSKAVADELWAMRDNTYFSFVDLIRDMDYRKAFNARSIEVLIRMDYFREFGKNGKLLEIWRQYKTGEDMAFKKTYVAGTQQKRLAALTTFERNCPDEEVAPPEQLSFESIYYGSPLSVFKDQRNMYVVLGADTKYSPKITMYSASTGATGVMKVKKQTFAEHPLEPGDVILLGEWERRPKYTYQDKKPIPIPGQTELWMFDYVVVFKADDMKDGA